MSVRPLQAGHDEHADPYIVHTCSLSASQCDQTLIEVALNYNNNMLAKFLKLHSV